MLSRYLTYCAQAKILQLLKNASAAGVNLTSGRGALEIEFIFSPDQACDIMISSAPTIYTNAATLCQLKNGCIDFSYAPMGGEFIISRL